MTTFFTSDTHYRHHNIIRYNNRPFQNVDEMQEVMIANWNSVVSYKDTVYHLGDFILGGNPSAILSRLNGHKFLIRGNHDKRPHHKDGWKDIFYYKEINIEKQHIVLMHYALRVWSRSHHGSWSLYGHSHGNLEDIPTSLSFDVGVDCHNYTPISFEEVKRLMQPKIKAREMES